MSSTTIVQDQGAQTTTTTATKPGYKTTEFWLSLLAMIVGLLYTSGVISSGTTADKIAGLAVQVLAALGYSVSRGLAKSSS